MNDIAPNSFLRKFLEAAQRTGGNLVSPWMALGEQQASAMRIKNGGIGIIRNNWIVGGENPPNSYASPQELSLLILQAQTYYWTNKVFTTLQECPMPDHIISDELSPYPVCYHALELRYAYSPEQIDNLREPTTASMIHDDSAYEWFLTIERTNYLDIYIFVSSISDPRGGSFFIYQKIPYRTKYPEDFGRKAGDVGMLLAMMAFLRSPDKHIEKHGIPRSIRRSVSDKRVFDEKQVNVVTIRRNIYEQKKLENNGQSVDWRHRWWVAGHMRAQWHPSKQAHELTWIAPYLKGPDDKPLLPKVYNVARK